MDDNNKQYFGAYIRRKRQEAGLTQRALGEALYVTESTVSKWERGLSYPDVSLIPEVCRVLAISEHEFFTACDDDKAHARERAARSWRRLTNVWRWGFGGSYLIAAVTCLICDICDGGGLRWSLIALASLLLGACFTNLPLHVKKRRGTVTLAAATGALFLLLAVCWLVTGSWNLLTALAITAVSLTLPWGCWALWRFYGCHLPVVCSGWATVWTFGLLAAICGLTGGHWLLTLAWPIAAFVWAAYWACFAIARWLPASGWLKAGLYTLLAAALLPLGTGLAGLLAPGSVRPIPWWSWWAIFTGDPDWINILTFAVLLAAAAVLIVMGLIRTIRHKKS